MIRRAHISAGTPTAARVGAGSQHSAFSCCKKHRSLCHTDVMVLHGLNRGICIPYLEMLSRATKPICCVVTQLLD